jgi:hypothetical protein
MAQKNAGPFEHFGKFRNRSWVGLNQADIEARD